MTNHTWVLEVLKDMKSYANENELFDLERAIDATLSTCMESPHLRQLFQLEAEVMFPSFSKGEQEAELKRTSNANLLLVSRK